MIEILASSSLVTIQDRGRFGLRQFGVGSAGAMDGLALRVGNLMLANSPDAAAIEVTASTFKTRFETDTVFALTGADADAKLDGRPVPPWWVMPASAGSELALRPPRRGLRTYVALAGGVSVPLLMGSRSTDVKCGFGGLEGRALRAGDKLDIGEALPFSGPRTGFGVSSPWAEIGPHQAASSDGALETTVRALPAAQYECFEAAVRDAFWSTTWTLTPDSNRMGLRLTGQALVRAESQELLSHGILPGVIQIPPSGQPIIQVSDANTCGGYPKIAVVIGADLWRLGQLRIGGKLKLVEADWQSSLAALTEQQAFIASVQQSVMLARRLT